MADQFGDNWPWIMLTAWLIGAWALSLPFKRSRRGRRQPSFRGTMPGQRRRAHYVCLTYQIRRRKTLEHVLPKSPELRSTYLRAQFFVRYAGDFRPNKILREWFQSSEWQDQRTQFERLRDENIEFSLTAIKENDIAAIYHPRPIALTFPLALSFPLLPTQFCIFVIRNFPYVHDHKSGVIVSGIYRCEVLDWRDEDSYAETVELKSMNDDKTYIDQVSLIDAIRLEKAAIESVNFLNLPIYLYTSRNRPLSKLRKEQRSDSHLVVRRSTSRDFHILDGKLLKLFGGPNPANFERLSWFYHPVRGVKPDEAKHKRLIAQSSNSG